MLNIFGRQKNPALVIMTKCGMIEGFFYYVFPSTRIYDVVIISYLPYDLYLFFSQ